MQKGSFRPRYTVTKLLGEKFKNHTNPISPVKITMGTSVWLGQIMAVVLKFRQFVPPWVPYIAVLPQEPGKLISLLLLFAISIADDKNSQNTIRLTMFQGS